MGDKRIGIDQRGLCICSKADNAKFKVFYIIQLKYELEAKNHDNRRRSGQEFTNAIKRASRTQNGAIRDFISGICGKE